MAESENPIMFIGSYATVEEAIADFEAIKYLKAKEFIGDYESAVFKKTEDGKIKILDTDATERGWGAKTGLVTGAVVGMLFPPTILAMGAAGAGVGAVMGNMMRGLKRKDLLAMGELLDEGTAGVVLVGFATVEAGVEQMMKGAAKIIKKEIDAQAADLKAAVDEAAEL